MIRVAVLETKADGKVYSKDDQSYNNPTFVVESEGMLCAGLISEKGVTTIALNSTWVDQKIFETIMSKIAQALAAQQE